MEWEFVELEDVDLEGSLLVAGVPSVGVAGPVAASCLVERLGMRIVGSLQSDDLPPIATVRRGVATSPVQVWATEITCGLDGRCDRLLVLKSDLTLSTPVLMPLATEIARWAAQKKLDLLVGLEGYPEESAPSDQKGLLVASSMAGASVVDRLGLTALQDTALTGFNAALVLRANRERLPAVALYAPVGSKGEGADAAVSLLGVVAPLVPNLGFSATDLEEKARVLESRMLQEQGRQAALARRMREESQRGYA